VNDKGGLKNPIAWLLRASLVLLGASIALNLAVAFLQPVVPWLAGGFLVAFLGWCVVAFIRWRRSRW
jgi:membrane protein YdbS with pleckstrin-like domain